jgi:hypothetical protein
MLFRLVKQSFEEYLAWTNMKETMYDDGNGGRKKTITQDHRLRIGQYHPLIIGILQLFSTLSAQEVSTELLLML